ncbi:MAG: flagellar biosynthesis regulator FlaF [Deltaproteobacteria bacterium]|nr:flagellar biosynthesis regulator FlaF [Deltaproteobacteria bacterium]
MHAAHLEAYRAVQKSQNSGRELEATVLTKAALKLRECQNSWDAPDRAARLADALDFNQKVWTVFQSELVRSDNPLPAELRQNILTLSAFIDKRIFEVMTDPKPEALSAIISINLGIAAGLRGNR